MVRIGAVCVWFLVGCLTIQAGDTPKASTVKKLAQQLGDWTIKGEYAKIIDSTYEGLVKELGGRDKAIQITEGIMKELADKGITFKSYKVGEPGKFHSKGDKTFVIVPTTVEMTIPDGKMIVTGYLLGISSNKGKTWTFADGAGVSKKALRDKLFPQLPVDLKLPEIEKPKVIKDK
jgi:hypothetical protein